MTAAPRGRVLCALDEIEDGQGRGFVLGEGAEQIDILVVRQGRRVFGYVNSCPHVGTPLDWMPDRFMSEGGDYLMCHTHGALFRIEDGYCIDGPCGGDSLTPLQVVVDREGQVVWRAG